MQQNKEVLKGYFQDYRFNDLIDSLLLAQEGNSITQVSTVDGNTQLTLSDGSEITITSSGGGTSEPVITDRISQSIQDEYYVGFNADGAWKINKYDAALVKTTASQSNNVEATLTEAWNNLTQLNYN